MATIYAEGIFQRAALQLYPRVPDARAGGNRRSRNETGSTQASSSASRVNSVRISNSGAN